jgi:hypothetical protein
MLSGLHLSEFVTAVESPKYHKFSTSWGHEGKINNQIFKTIINFFFLKMKKINKFTKILKYEQVIGDRKRQFYCGLQDLKLQKHRLRLGFRDFNTQGDRKR